MRRLVFCGLTFAMLAGAADLAGTWQNETPGRGGQPNITTCVFKVDGTKITGTYATSQRAFPIEKGTMDGSQFSFQTSDGFQTPPRITEYKGALVGDQFDLTTVTPAGAPARGFGRGPQGPRTFKKKTPRLPGRFFIGALTKSPAHCLRKCTRGDIGLDSCRDSAPFLKGKDSCLNQTPACGGPKQDA